MGARYLFILLITGLVACHKESQEEKDLSSRGTKIQIGFDRGKWAEKDGRDYPYRDQMLNDLVYNDTVRSLNEDQILDLLGKPDRMTDGHLYYQIDQKHLGAWVIHTKTLVIKLAGDSKVEWMKIHE